jgi:hypothetical protein
MSADLLISQLLEAVEVGDDGVYLQPRKPIWQDEPDDGYDSWHEFDIHHPVHGVIGCLAGSHSKDKNAFLVDYITLRDHPNYKSQLERPTSPFRSEKHGPDDYEGVSRTLVRAGLRSLMKHIPGLKTIAGFNRVTGTHAIASKGGTGPLSNTSVGIPKRMRQG